MVRGKGRAIHTDFDQIIDRNGTWSEKWERYRGRDILPLWVADMDFRSPPAVIEALKQRAEHGVFGYTTAPEELTETLVSHLFEEFSWRVSAEWIVYLPGLVSGIHCACRSVGSEGGEILTSTPVYPPFLSAPRCSRRNLVAIPLTETGGCFALDFQRLERAITSRTELFLLCNPHNPVGRVYSMQELIRIADLCERHNLFICSDEIHAGLVLDPDKRHIPIASLSAGVASRTMTLLAPSKTFNIPGLGCAFAVIPDPLLRSRFLETMEGIVPPVNALGYTAALAAYRTGGEWHRELIAYLRENRDLVAERVGKMPGLAVNHVEATYLAWIDTRGSGIPDPASFFERGGVGLSDGAAFGDRGRLRLNFGCPRPILRQALSRMELALKGLHDISRMGKK